VENAKGLWKSKNEALKTFGKRKEVGWAMSSEGTGGHRKKLVGMNTGRPAEFLGGENPGAVLTARPDEQLALLRPLVQDRRDTKRENGKGEMVQDSAGRGHPQLNFCQLSGEWCEWLTN